jgi:hypothetical protein
LIVVGGLGFFALIGGLLWWKLEKPLPERTVTHRDPYTGQRSTETIPGGKTWLPAIVALVGLVFFAVGGMGIIVASHQSIPARNVGVVTVQGRPSGVVSNGGHWMRPWSKVTLFPTVIQPVTFDQVVRLKNNTEAHVDVSAQWQIDPNDQFLSLYNNWQTFANVENNVVKRSLQVALNDQFAGWDPLAVIDQKGGSTVAVTTLAAPVEQEVNAAMPSGLVLRSVKIVGITYSPDVQQNLNAVTKQAAQTLVAQRLEDTNKAVAAANAALGTSAQAFQQNCLNVVNNAIANKYQLPANFNCNSGGASLPLTVQAK